MSNIARGTELGRYLVLAELGAGGMGVVVAAYDPELDRRVALKLVRAELSEGERGEDALLRLQREAQTMARLSHPNVVTVFDVGTVLDTTTKAEQLFVAMEYAAGDMRKWLQEKARPLGEVLTMFRQAGRGLAAVHAADLVHCDFKPANVLIAADERALVSDFGLVAALEQQRSRRLGTPRYMAPEQFAGDAVAAAADQFAFCVALYEALYQQRPFAGNTVDEVADSVLAGRLQEPSGDAKLPEWLWPIVARGLALDPAARHDSMSALLSALDNDPAVEHRRGLVLGAMLEFGRSRAEAGDFQAAETALKDALADATSMGRRSEAATAQVSLALMDAKRGQTSRARERLSWVEQVLADVDDPLLAARLRSARGSLSHRAHELESARDDYAYALQRFEENLGRDSVEVIEMQVNLATIAQRLGDSSGASTTLEAAYQDIVTARGTMAPVVASVLDAWAAVLQDLGQFEPALQRHEQALAMRDKLLGSRHPATIDSMVRVGQALLAMGRDDDAINHLTRALSLAEQVIGPESESVRASLNALGHAYLKKGRPRDSWEVLERALAISEHIYGLDHPDVAETLINIGQTWAASANHTLALELYRRALTIREQAFAWDHPLIAETLHSVANSYLQSGDVERALEVYSRVQSDVIRARGPRHPTVAFVLVNAASALLSINPARIDEAEERLNRAEDIARAHLGDEHEIFSISAGNRGKIAMLRARPEEAIEHFSRAIALQDAAGRGAESLVRTLNDMAHCLIEAERHGEAIAPLERAISLAEPFGDSVLLAKVRAYLASALWDGGGDRKRAEQLARTAHASFVELGADRLLPFLNDWMRERELQ